MPTGATTRIGAALGRRGPAIALVALLLAFSGLSLSVAVLTPPWEANDEPDHVRNVQKLVDGRMYRITDADAGLEPHQPPLYYLVLAAGQGLLAIPPQPVAPEFAPVAPESFLFRHDIAADGLQQRLLTILRLPGVLMSLIVIVLTWWIGRTLSSDPWTPVVAAAFVAGVPRFAFLGGVVNNDNLANVLGASALALATVAVKQAPSASPSRAQGLAAGLGALAGLLVLSKLTTVFLLPALGVALWMLGRSGRDRLRLSLTAAAVGLVVCGPWLAFNWSTYGDPLASRASHDHLSRVLPALFDVGSPVEQSFDATPRQVFRSFWYTSGWNQFKWRSAVVHWLLWIALAVGISGLLRGTSSSPRGPPRGALIVLLLAAAGGIAAIWYLGIITTTSQGRVGFFALPAVGLLFALGLERWRAPVLLRFVLPAAGIALALVAIQRDIVALAFP